MNKIKDFYSSFGFIVGFLLFCVVISAVMGQKFLNKFLLLVLTSQIIFNMDIFENLLSKFEKSVEKVNTIKTTNQNAIQNGTVKL